MSYRNLLFALAFVAPIFWFSQGAYAEPQWGGDWSGGWGSEKVVGTCSGKGTVEVGGNVADLNWDGTCIFSKPNTKPATFNVPCHIDLTYTLPNAPDFEGSGPPFVQNWRAACNSGVQVTGLLHCDAVPGKSPEINNPLGLAGDNGSTITNSICQQVFGSADSLVLNAQVQFEAKFAQSRVIDLSPTTTWNACHADVLNDRTATVSCIDNKDIQKVLSTGTNPVTRAYCEYTPGDTQPINSNCGGDEGNITVALFADKPTTAEPGIISISLDSVDLGSFLVNGVPPKPNDGQCEQKTVGGKDAIVCKFPTCVKKQFIFSSGIATLTAKRDPQEGQTIGTGIQCINQVQIK
jgi:hypothetical protein